MCHSAQADLNRFMQMISKYFDHLRQLKRADQSKRLAVEITIILLVKLMLLWLIWAMFFSHPIAKETRQSAVTRVILNKTN